MISRKTAIWFLTTFWITAFIIAILLDAPVAQQLHDHPFVNRHSHVIKSLLETVKLPGWFYTTLAVALLLAFFHHRHGLAAIALTASGIAVGAVYSLLKWMTGRHRPDHGIHPMELHPFAQGLPGLWREKALCFPSGHASLAFASAASLAILLPRWRAVFYVIALMTAVERVAENAHYLSDVVAGIGLGIVVGKLITQLVMNAPQSTLTPPSEGMPIS